MSCLSVTSPELIGGTLDNTQKGKKNIKQQNAVIQKGPTREDNQPADWVANLRSIGKRMWVCIIG